MTVPSPLFLAFAGLAAIIYNLSLARWWRQGVLLICNILFLLSFSHVPAEFAPFGYFLLTGYVMVTVLRGGVPRALQALYVIALLLLFFLLKKYAFFPSSLLLPMPYIVIGLSYVFFRVMHLVVDARKEPISPLSYLNYTLNFTSLVSGPIQLYNDYRRTAEGEPQRPGVVEIGRALERIVLGVFKVMVVSALLGVLQHEATARALLPGDLLQRATTAALLVGVFPLFLYANFSGYIDTVIGAAHLFCIDLPENFDRPFSSASFIEYWSRWHITLSNWLKTYVFNPLLTTMMRRVPQPALTPYLGVAALFVTFFLIGAWHGQTAHFFVFGLLNGLGIALNQLYRVLMVKRLGRKPFAKLSSRPMYLAAGRGLTFTWVGITLMWFWGDGPELARLWTALGPLAWMLGAAGLALASAVMLTLLALGPRLFALPSGAGVVLALGSRYTRAALATCLMMVTLGFQIAAQSPAPDVVYRNF